MLFLGQIVSVRMQGGGFSYRSTRELVTALVGMDSVRAISQEPVASAF